MVVGIGAVGSEVGGGDDVSLTGLVLAGVAAIGVFEAFFKVCFGFGDGFMRFVPVRQIVVVALLMFTKLLFLMSFANGQFRDINAIGPETASPFSVKIMNIISTEPVMIGRVN